MNEITLEKYIAKYINKNALKNSEYAYKDIMILISNYLNISKDKLYTMLKDMYLDSRQAVEINDLLNKYFIDNIPLQYLTNLKLFFNEKYFVNENVLIPRDDTEILVEKAIDYIDKYSLKNIIDICTGSGCIGISIANNSSIDKVLLVDISKSALDVAEKNVKLNNVKKDISLIRSDLFLNIPNNIKYDIIVSNPPYIPTNDILSLDVKVQKEPRLALDGGKDGMDIYRSIINDARPYLKDNGFLLFEIGYDELESIKKIFSNYKEYEILESVKDLAGNDRVIICRFHQI